MGNWILVDSEPGWTLDSTPTALSILHVDLAKGTNNNLVTGWGTATVQANVSGTNTLVKSGPNRLILDPATANTYTGGTIISNGILQVGVGGNPPPRSSNPIGLGS